MNNGNNGNVVEDTKLGHLKESVKGLVDKGEEKVDQIKTKVVDVKDQAVERGGMLLDKATEFVRNNPLKSVGIAFGVGYIGMRLFRR